jgi:tartrate/fumarate subfamily iron-sulfur-dependent hydro-lyase beta chain
MQFNLKTPLSKEDVLKLRLGDEVLISGELVTARDRAHLYLSEKKQELPFSLDGGVVFHMGPIVRKENGKWRVVAAGPTTSARLDKYTENLIRDYGVRGIIGKGGMGENTRNALKKYGAAYLSATGGLAAVLAQSIEEVADVYKLEDFGAPEAMWRLKVRDFPAIVTMDANGNSLHDGVKRESEARLKKIL